MTSLLILWSLYKAPILVMSFTAASDLALKTSDGFVYVISIGLFVQQIIPMS